ncbi:MAG: hypothetical protein OQJ74_07035 [Ignavibacteriaceae bacterium]|nr:hypothetical protein [Ignavibacteriaceae bacterium]
MNRQNIDVFDDSDFALKNLVLRHERDFQWALLVPHCGSQSSSALPEESLQEFEVNYS